MIYLDTSALAKLLRHEPETVALSGWLRERAHHPWVTSLVGRIELMRVTARYPAITRSAVDVLVAGLNLVPLSESVVFSAETAGPPLLRTLDAIHLASALTVADTLDTFCCYDERLTAAAAQHGLEVAAPR